MASSKKSITWITVGGRHIPLNTSGGVSVKSQGKYKVDIIDKSSGYPIKKTVTNSQFKKMAILSRSGKYKTQK